MFQRPILESMRLVGELRGSLYHHGWLHMVHTSQHDMWNRVYCAEKHIYAPGTAVRWHQGAAVFLHRAPSCTMIPRRTAVHTPRPAPCTISHHAEDARGGVRRGVTGHGRARATPF